MADVSKRLATDETLRAVVDALNNRESVQQAKAEIQAEGAAQVANVTAAAEEITGKVAQIDSNTQGIGELRSELMQLTHGNSLYADFYEVGGFALLTGAYTSSSIAVRTHDYIPKNIIGISAPTYIPILFAYDKYGTYVGHSTDAGTIEKNNTWPSAPFLATAGIFEKYPDYCYRLACYTNPNRSITVEEANSDITIQIAYGNKAITEESILINATDLEQGNYNGNLSIYTNVTTNLIAKRPIFVPKGSTIFFKQAKAYTICNIIYVDERWMYVSETGMMYKNTSISVDADKYIIPVFTPQNTPATVEAYDAQLFIINSAYKYLKDRMDALDGDLPNYFLEDANASMLKVGKLAGERLSFSFITDTHGKYEHFKYIKHINDYHMTDFCVVGGDINYKEKSFDDAVMSLSGISKVLAENTYMTRGNHDGLQGSTDLSNSIFLNLTSKISPNIANCQPNGYYYVDLERYKTRLIVMNDSLDLQARRGFDITQLKWLYQQALATDGEKADWYFIVVSHGHTYAELIDLPVPSYAEQFNKILQARQNASTYVDQAHNINVDFTSCEPNKIMFHLFGHMHLDCAVKRDDVWQICTLCSLAVKQPANEYTQTYDRVGGTDTEYAMDVFSINMNTFVLNITRIGAGVDREVNLFA